jgi:hypothetical protein
MNGDDDKPSILGYAFVEFAGILVPVQIMD